MKKDEDADSHSQKGAVPSQETPSVETPAGEAASETSASPEAALTGEEIAELRSKALERERFHDKYLRARADLENYRKRASREMEEARLFGIAPFAREVLQVRDDFTRTLAAAEAGEKDLTALLEGVRVARDQLDKALSSFHIEAIPAKGLPFNPSVHEAVSLEVTDAHPDHTVIEEVQVGFTLRDRLLRPARVVVSRRPGREDAEEVDREQPS